MLDNQEGVDLANPNKDPNQTLIQEKENMNAKWLDNEDNAVENVFGFNKNAELVNSRAAMVGFLMLVLTELLFKGEPVTTAIFGIN